MEVADIICKVTKTESYCVLVTGTPGVGKSCFFPYLMLRLSEVTNVAVQVGSHFYIHVYDFKKNTFIVFDPELHCCEFLNLCFFCLISKTTLQLCIRPFRSCAIGFSYRLQIWINLNVLKNSFPKSNFLYQPGRAETKTPAKNECSIGAEYQMFAGDEDAH